MKLFKLGSLIALALLASVSMASEALARPDCNVGLGIGLSNASARVDAGSGLDATTDKLAAKGAIGQIAAGCDFTIAEKYVLGGVVDYALGNVTARDVSSVASISGMWDVALRAGYKLNPEVLVFAKVGYGGANSRLTQGTDTQNGALRGVVFGLGADINLIERTALRISWDRHQFGSVGLLPSTSSKLTADVLGATVLYKF